MFSPTSELTIVTLRRLVREHDLQAFFERAAVEAARLAGADGAAFIEVLDSTTMRYRFFKGLPAAHQQMAAELVFSRENSTSGLALANGEPVFTANYPQHAHAMPDFVASGLKANLLVPCGAAHEASGVLAVAWFERFPEKAPDPQTLECILLITDLMHSALYRQSLQDDLAWQARHDSLTGLPNRRYLAAGLPPRQRDKLASMQRAVAVLDLDDFKQVNDRFGHQAGDHVLRALADRFRDHLHADDIAVRFGGDEFVLILERDTARESWSSVFDTLTTALNQPYWLNDGTRLTCSCSVGVTYNSDGPQAIEEQIREADQALYRIKAIKSFRAVSWQRY